EERFKVVPISIVNNNHIARNSPVVFTVLRGSVQLTHIRVHIKSTFIMNGVCVRWRGWIDVERLDGVGCLEYNEERAAQEDALLREQIERYNQRLREFEDKQRVYRPERPDQDLE
ncbi:hypothetical protein NQ315_015637, partial [Exocentrus adspersus]